MSAPNGDRGHPNAAATQFKSGAEWKGNAGGRPKMKPWRDALRAEIERRAAPDAEDKLASGLQKLAKIVVDNAELGDKDCWQEIGNRLEGRVPQALVGDSDNPLEILQRVERVVVRPNPKD